MADPARHESSDTHPGHPASPAQPEGRGPGVGFDIPEPYFSLGGVARVVGALFIMAAIFMLITAATGFLRRRFLSGQPDLGPDIFNALLCTIVLAVAGDILHRRRRRTWVAAARTTAEAAARFAERVRGKEFNPDRRELALQAAQLVRCGHAGFTARTALGIELRPLAPLPYTFEPLELDDASETIQELLAAARAEEAMTDEPVAPAARRRRRPSWLRGLPGGDAIGITAIFALYIFASGFRRGVVSALPCVFVVFLGAILTQRSRYTGGTWLVVPGGIVLRRGRLWSSDSTVHLFDRMKSALIATYSRRLGFWWVAVADSTNVARRLVSHDECEFLLRAWLSPVPPPPIELLHELA